MRGVVVALVGILCIALCHLGYLVSSWLALVLMAAIVFKEERV